MNDNKKIVMLTTSSPGGMLSVIEGYQRDGVFDRWDVHLVSTHTQGSLISRLRRAANAFLHVFLLAVKDRIALLHCHVSIYGSFWRKSLFMTLAHFFHIPVILHLHGGETKEFYNSLPLVGKRLVSQQLSAAKVVLVLSKSWRIFVLDVAPKARVIVLPNYVDIPVYTRPLYKGTKVNVLFLGVIDEKKGIYDLLSAFAGVVKNRPKFFLRIGGYGEIEKAREIVYELGLDSHIEFLGWVGKDAKYQLFLDSDIFVLPSYHEGLPVSILEAMSWSIPVITTTVGSIPEVIEDNVNGYLISPGNILELQNLLEQLGGDPAIRERVGLAGKMTVQKQFSKEAVLPKLESLYAELITKH